MAGTRDADPLDSAIGRMGEVSWLFLRVLHPTEAKPAIRILMEAEQLLADAGRGREIDPSTLHYALKRMEQDGLVRQDGRQQVPVPGGRGGFRSEERTVFVITQQVQEALARHDRLHEIAKRRYALPGFAQRIVGGMVPWASN